MNLLHKDMLPDNDTQEWHIKKTISGIDRLKCPECGHMLVIDHIDYSTSSPVKCMICGGCGNEYRVTKTPTQPAEDWKIPASRKLGEKLKNLHVGTKVHVDMVVKCRIKEFNELGNRVSIEIPIRLPDGSIVYGEIDEFVPISRIELAEQETYK